jgi:HSP20 family protein
MTIARFTPFSDAVSLREAMDRLFEDSFIRPSGSWIGQLAVPVDIWETKDGYHVRADLPGVTPDDLEINATADTLTISGELKAMTDVSNEGWLRQERRTGKFTRSFTLPMQIDPNKVDANFTNGVLELVLPKAENVKPRSIKINAHSGNNKP